MHQNMERALRKISIVTEDRICVGIIGNGKMGTGIIEEFFDKGFRVFVYCRSNIENTQQHIDRILKRKQKRNLITEEECSRKREEFRVTSRLEDLRECNLIIESISENLAAKQDVFQKIDTIVSKDCILATNTSSIPLSKIFQNVSRKERCLGMHFFYPVKISNTVEVNVLDVTGIKEYNVIKKIILNLGKMSVTFHEPNHMYLNNIISVISTQSYALAQKNNIHPYSFNHKVLAPIMLYGAFDIVDSVGIPIIRESLFNFMDERHKCIYMPFYNICSEMEKEGYLGIESGKSFYDYFTDYHSMKMNDIDETAGKKYRDIVMSVCLNDLLYVLSEIQEDEVEVFLQAAKDVLGFSKDIKDLYNELGYEKIKNLLNEQESQNESKIYKTRTKEEFESFFR